MRTGRAEVPGKHLRTSSCYTPTHTHPLFSTAAQRTSLATCKELLAADSEARIKLKQKERFRWQVQGFIYKERRQHQHSRLLIC